MQDGRERDDGKPSSAGLPLVLFSFPSHLALHATDFSYPRSEENLRCLLLEVLAMIWKNEHSIISLAFSKTTSRSIQLIESLKKLWFCVGGGAKQDNLVLSMTELKM